MGLWDSQDVEQNKSISESCFACLRTARGTAAIGSLEVWGPAAKEMVRRVFVPHAAGIELEAGRIVYGHFKEDEEVIDSGIVGCEGTERLALHCHGNPLILERVLRLLESYGAEIVSLDAMRLMQNMDASSNLIEAEAKVESLRAVSLEGMRLIQSQETAGLAAVVQKWIERPEPDVIRRQAQEILDRSRIAERIIRPVKVLLAGPPNSGKSTLLNRLAACEQAIVSDTPGTTRDWISAFGRIDPLYIEWVDTAGLDESLSRADELDQAAQEKTREQICSADLILYILDGSESTMDRPPVFPPEIPVLTVLNKCDLPFAMGQDAESVSISAKEGRGIGDLAAAILDALEVETIRPDEPVVFTLRQKQCMEVIVQANEEETLRAALYSLCSG